MVEQYSCQSLLPLLLRHVTDDDTYKLFKGFSQRPHGNVNSSSRNASVKLRHQAISFVSAGASTAAEEEQRQSEEAVVVPAEDSEEDSYESEAEDDLDESTIQTNIVTDTDIEASQGGIAHMNIHGAAETSTMGGNNADTHMSGADGSDGNAAHGDAELFVVDTEGDPSLATMSKPNGKRPEQREESPTLSDSSDEVVVFHGRNKLASNTPSRAGLARPTTTQTSAAKATTSQSSTNQNTIAAMPPFPSSRLPHPQHTGNTIEFAVQRQTEPISDKSFTAKGWAAAPSKADKEVNPDAIWAPAPSGSWWKKGKARPDLDLPPGEKAAIEAMPVRPSRVMFAEPPDEGKMVLEDTPTNTANDSSSKPQDEDNAAETIASLQAECRAIMRDRKVARDSSSSKARDFLSLDAPQSRRRSKRGRKKDNRQLRQPIDSEVEDDAGEAAYDDYMSNLAAQMDGNDSDGEGAHGFTAVNAFQSRAMGGPSLVVDGGEIADNRHLSHADLMNNEDTSSASSGPIGMDLSELSSDDDEDLDSSELEDALEYTEREQWEDEVDLRRRRQEAMTDEQIAKMFAKQEELGILDDDLVLENGEYDSLDDDMNGIGDVAEARAGLANITNFTSGRSSNKRRGKPSGKDLFPDASALADTVEQYGENGFDIMDFDRPSLRPTKKGRKGNLPPELEALSDEELKDTMRSTWERDRNSKRQKKLEREELRAQGLLGSAGRNGKADFNQKYQYGITTKQIHQELRAFLEDDGQQARPFPPMDKKERKALHEIASVLGLKSKSVGAGNDRFPVLHKTGSTYYTPELFEHAIEASLKGSLERGGDRKWAKKFASRNERKAGKIGKKGGAGGGFNNAAVSLRNGEIVGAGAAEISKDSFGHKMMEKMGWSKGMALGKEGEGRLVPVEQVMRAGKAGLG